MSLYYTDEHITLHHGDALAVARDLPTGSVDCIVTSPPYYGLRNYGSMYQYGLEDSPAEYVENLRALFHELRRVLADDGTLWLNIGDSYASTGGMEGVGPNATVGSTQRQSAGRTRPKSALPAKNLMGMPWRTAFALQDDGWILRNSIIWYKPNAMPESVTDRLSNRYENIFLFSKAQRYWFDLDPVREALIYPEAADGSRTFGGVNKAPQLQTGSSTRRTGGTYGGKGQATPLNPQTGKDKDPSHSQVNPSGKNPGDVWKVDAPQPKPSSGKRTPRDEPDGNGQHTYGGTHPNGRNPGDVWEINTQPYPGAHFAVFPKELARRCIVAGCKPGGTVLDPFSGSGTTGIVAQNNGRKYVGIDISAEYLKLSLETRLQNGALF